MTNPFELRGCLISECEHCYGSHFCGHLKMALSLLDLTLSNSDTIVRERYESIKSELLQWAFPLSLETCTYKNRTERVVQLTYELLKLSNRKIITNKLHKFKNPNIKSEGKPLSFYKEETHYE